MQQLNNMQLYSYFRSSAAFRVRIALNLKGLEYDIIPVHMLREGGQQHKPEYRRLNPQGLVPTLALDNAVLTQSLAICEYLEECYLQPPLLPANALQRARVRALAAAVACDMHPLNNLRVLKYLVKELGASDEQKLEWYRHWVEVGFNGIEEMLSQSAETGTYCHGETPGLADVCLIPQVWNALRFNCPMEAYPTINRIYAQCMSLPAFAAAQPDRQPDAD